MNILEVNRSALANMYEQFPDSFSLINKKTKYPLDSGRMLVIPFTFRPQVLAKYSADIFVYISKTLFWRYPIE